MLVLVTPVYWGEESEVLKNLKAQVDFNTPVIALTADVISGMEEKYTEQGFDDCLPKPIVEEELFYLLKKYLKEVTEEGLLAHNYGPIETPRNIASPLVKTALEPPYLSSLFLLHFSFHCHLPLKKYFLYSFYFFFRNREFPFLKLKKKF